MWRKEDGNPQSDVSYGPKSAASGSGPVVSGKAAACVSQGIKIKGELTGSEDLFIDGFVDGKVNLSNSVLTVGPNATVKAEITARELVVRGRAEGKFTASERVQIWHTARVHGDIKAERISIEEGAELHGKLEAGKPINSVNNEASQQAKKAAEVSRPNSRATEEKGATGAATAGAN
jgi:cytoskeletal protein CcmA (bactofilin family)